ncbi:hypothetical protein K438DRAFT_1687990, partial [Mycena galopus ATCC 62051]
MEFYREVEAGTPQIHRPAKGRSVLNRLALALSRVLGPYAVTSQSDSGSGAPGSNPDMSETSATFRSEEAATYEKGNYSKAENEEACAKIWSTYIGEAERYDAALVGSWKADMEGMLIFSGLFSASLTAFLIESYKNLQPDSGELTVAAITQISQQLAAIAGGGSFVLQTAAPFTPTAASLVCNAL